MTNKAVEWFLVKVLRTSKNEAGQASVQKLDATNAEIEKLASGKTDAFVINDSLAKVVTPAPAIAPVSAIAPPQAQASGASQVTSAWSAMPGGWATLAASGSAAALASHGNYPIHDSVARVAAGKIISTGPSTSYASMPGGWASLGNTVATPSAAPTTTAMPTAVAPAASAPAPAAPPAASPVTANNQNTSGTSAWSGMPGGWATLAAAGGAAALASHGNYPIHDGVARVAAGKIISTGPSTSYASMPGGWASLGNTATAPSAAPTATPIAAASAPAPAAPPAASARPAHNENTAVGEAWAGMPGGWATLAATIGSAALTPHGNYPLHDGIARVAAGKILPSGSNMSWAGMPGGWASLHRYV